MTSIKDIDNDLNRQLLIVQGKKKHFVDNRLFYSSLIDKYGEDVNISYANQAPEVTIYIPPSQSQSDCLEFLHSYGFSFAAFTALKLSGYSVHTSRPADNPRGIRFTIESYEVI